MLSPGDISFISDKEKYCLIKLLISLLNKGHLKNKTKQNQRTEIDLGSWTAQTNILKLKKINDGVGVLTD